MPFSISKVMLELKMHSYDFFRNISKPWEFFFVRFWLRFSSGKQWTKAGEQKLKYKTEHKNRKPPVIWSGTTVQALPDTNHDLTRTLTYLTITHTFLQPQSSEINSNKSTYTTNKKHSIILYISTRSQIKWNCWN